MTRTCDPKGDQLEAEGRIELPYFLFLELGSRFKFQLDFGDQGQVDFALTVTSTRPNDPTILKEVWDGKEYGLAPTADGRFLDQNSVIEYSFHSELFRFSPSKVTRGFKQFNREQELVSNCTNLLVEAINHLLTVYRHVVGEPMVRRLSVLDLRAISVKAKHGTLQGELKALKGSASPMRVAPVPELTGQKKQAYDRITELLQQETPVPLEEDLHLDASGQFWRNDNRTAVVTAHSAVQVALGKFLRRKFSERQVPQDVVDHLLERFEASRSMSTLVPLATGQHGLRISRIWGRQLWNRWQEFNQLRNDVVHGRQARVSHQQAVSCITAAGEILDWFRSY
jgi:hypothetical protein